MAPWGRKHHPPPAMMLQGGSAPTPSPSSTPPSQQGCPCSSAWHPPEAGSAGRRMESPAPGCSLTLPRGPLSAQLDQATLLLLAEQAPDGGLDPLPLGALVQGVLAAGAAGLLLQRAGHGGGRGTAKSLGCPGRTPAHSRAAPQAPEPGPGDAALTPCRPPGSEQGGQASPAAGPGVRTGEMSRI